MNHLREIVDPSSRRLLANDDCKVDEPEHFTARTRELAENAMCFYFGDIGQLEGLSIVDDLCRPPFPTCWFEFLTPFDDGSSLGLCGMMAHCIGNKLTDGTQFYYWVKVAGQWTLRGAAFFCDEPGTPRLAVVPPTQQMTREMQGAVACVATFLSALNCSNVRRREHVPPQKLQAARVRRGKKPLFSYWTLELSPSVEAPNLGGSHASPRLHLRRGHPRQFAPGRYCWVQPHVVGNKNLGMVHKDYKWAA